MISFRLAPVALLAALPTLVMATPPGDVLNRSIHRKLAEGGSWFTADEQAFVREKCEQEEGRPLTIEGDEMTCANGRVVRDPRVSNISRAVTARADARVRAVMASPEIVAALQRTIDASVRDAMARASARLDAVARTDR